MSRLAVVVLNYNDYENTSAQVERIIGYSAIEYIIVVDNCSSDDSAERLSKRLGEWNSCEGSMENGGWEQGERCASSSNFASRVRIIRAERNGGYGYGNNLGMSCAEKLKMTHVLIANPDTEFSEELLYKMLEGFKIYGSCDSMSANYKNIGRLGAVSAMMRDGIGQQRTAWPLRGFMGELLNSGPICRRIFSGILNYPDSFFINAGNTGDGLRVLEVGAVHGSLLMLSIEAFKLSKGYDEEVFLYCEENILARRLKRSGFWIGIMPDYEYVHEGGGSTGKSYSGLLGRQKIRQRSERHYYGRYLNVGATGRALTIIFQAVVLMETLLLDVFTALFSQGRTAPDDKNFSMQL